MILRLCRRQGKNMDKEQEKQFIRLAQQGDVEAENSVALAYLNLAKSIARSFGVAGAYDTDDLAGYGMLGLIRAIHTYDENGKANFKTYASRCIKNAIVDAVRKMDSAAVEIKLDSVGDELQSELQEANPESIFRENETSTLLFEAISSLLTPTELDVLKLHLECMSYADIANELGLERKKVDNTIYSAKKKIRKLLDKENE